MSSSVDFTRWRRLSDTACVQLLFAKGELNGPDTFKVAACGAQPAAFHHRAGTVSVRGSEAAQNPGGVALREGPPDVIVWSRRHDRVDFGWPAIAWPVYSAGRVHSVGRDGLRLFHRTFPEELLPGRQRRFAGDRTLLHLSVSLNCRRRTDQYRRADG